MGSGEDEFGGFGKDRKGSVSSILTILFMYANLINYLLHHPETYIGWDHFKGTPRILVSFPITEELWKITNKIHTKWIASQEEGSVS